MAETRKAEHELFKGTKDLATAEIGDVIGSIEFVVTEDLVNRLSWALDDYNPWYFDGSPLGVRIAPATAPLQFNSTIYDYAYARAARCSPSRNLSSCGRSRSAKPTS